MAFAPHNQTISARLGQAHQLGAATSELPYATPLFGENRPCRRQHVKIMTLVGCLSRMRGNSHVRFLGEGVAARLPPYPTRAVGSIPIARSNDLLSQRLCQACFFGKQTNYISLLRKCVTNVKDRVAAEVTRRLWQSCHWTSKYWVCPSIMIWTTSPKLPKTEHQFQKFRKCCPTP